MYSIMLKADHNLKKIIFQIESNLRKVRQDCTIPYVTGQSMNPEQLLVHLRRNQEEFAEFSLKMLFEQMEYMVGIYLTENQPEEAAKVQKEVVEMTQPYLQDRLKNLSKMRLQQKALTNVIESKKSNLKANGWWMKTLETNSANKSLLELIKSISTHSKDMR